MEPLPQAALTLPPNARSAARARRFVARTLDHWALAHLTDTTALLTSELVANAVRHTGTPLEVRLAREHGDVLVEVTDQGEGQPRPRLPDPDSETGRGLFLVDQLAEDWGVRGSARGKVLWFCLNERAGARA